MMFIPLPKTAMKQIHDLNNGRKWAVISITEPDSDWPEIVQTDDCKGILCLAFHDIDKPRDEYTLFTKDQAIQILDFIKEMENNKVDVLIVHCHAGLSRSPAVCAALAKIYEQNNEQYFKSYRPNAYVYSLLLNTHYGSKNNS